MATVSDNASHQFLPIEEEQEEESFAKVNNGIIILPINGPANLQCNLDRRTTSQQNPYKVIDIAHIVPNPESGLTEKARLTLSIAPGKKDNRWNRDLDVDLEIIKSNNIHVVVCLLEWSEMLMLSLTDYPRKAQEKGLLFYHMPIKDRGVTTQKDLSTLVPILVQHLSSGHNVLIHCRGGLGRAGTICGCCLGHFGYQGNTAIDAVRAQRPGAIQTTKQEDSVIQYCRSLLIG